MQLTNKKYVFAFIMITCLFFLWGFIHNFNPILIPHLKRSFTLSNAQSMLVDSAVYFAYFIMAIPAGMLMKRFGYKTGIINGLLIFAIGCFLFIPAANLQSYSFFLIALFVIASGLTVLETAANPYASALGDPESAPMRLNFSQSFNGLAATIAPIIGVKLILTETYTDQQLELMSATERSAALASEAASVKGPYLTLSLVLVAIAIIFSFIKLPKIQTEEAASGEVKSKNIFGALQHLHLKWAVVAQFFYVGAQVIVFSTFLLYAPVSAGISKADAGNLLSVCGLAFLIGRFIGTFIMQKIDARKLLMIYAAITIPLCLMAMFLTGMITVYIVVAICFFMSIMFPTIFALGIRGLKGDTEYGSSLIIMAIVGGAILPLLFGLITDSTGNVQLGYLVPLICFVVILVFASKNRFAAKA